MEKFIWSEKYSVGVKNLDDQHKVVFESINNLIEANDLTVRSESITDALIKMTEFFWDHLEVEEKYMKEYGYPEFEKHVIQHNEFREKIMDLNLDQMAHKDSVLEDLLIFLTGWWSNHILKVDMRYRSFFINKGLT